MSTSQNQTPQIDFIADVFQLAAVRRFPGKVDLSRKALPIVESLSPLWFDDLKEAKAFRILNAEALSLKDGDYITFATDVPVRRQLVSGGYPVARELEVVAESYAKELAESIHLSLPSQAKNKLTREIEIQKEELSQEKTSFEQRQAALLTTLHHQEQEIERRNAELDTRERDLVQHSQAIQELELRYAPFLPTGISNQPSQGYLPPSTFKALYADWPAMLRSYGHITSGDELPERSLLLSVLTAFMTGGLVLLDGPVGVGKTSIVGKSAKVLTGVDDASNIIPVRPGWIDPTDLVGFYDPRHRDYQPSVFLTSLNRARERSERLHIVCLDELNLARIENYGADLLSCMEYRDERQLTLYSPDVQQSLASELELISCSQHSNEEMIRGQKIAHTLSKFPAQFKVPYNIVMVGTLNSDETTYDISPKVIDRSFIVRLPIINLSIIGIGEKSEAGNSCVLNTCDFRQAVQAEISANVNFRLLVKTVAGLQEYLQVLGIPIGHRVMRDLEVFAATSHTVGLDDPTLILKHFILLKIIPRIRCQVNATTKKAWSDFQTHLREFLGTETAGVIENLERQWDDGNARYTIRYFDTVQ